MSIHTKDVSELSESQLRYLVEEIRDVLWPGGDPESEWNSDTASSVASILRSEGLAPQKVDMTGYEDP